MSTTWKHAAIEKANTIADAWDVTRVWLGQFAQWILFLCLIANIVEVVSSAPDWMVNFVLTVQAVTLDVAGFGLTSMADHAKQQGNKSAAALANWTGWILIVIMMLTVGGVTFGAIVPAYKPETEILEKGLIIIRVIATVLYGHVIHKVRGATETSQATQVHASVASQVQVQVQEVQATLQREVQMTVQRLQEQVQRSLALEVQTTVQRLLAEQGKETLASMQTTIDDTMQQAMHQTAQQLTARIDETHRQVKALIDTKVQAAIAEQAKAAPHMPVLRLVDRVQSVQDEHREVQASEQLEQGEQVQGDVQSKVTLYISGQLEQGHKPTIAEIMDACGCSKGTAIKYRKLVTGEVA